MRDSVAGRREGLDAAEAAARLRADGPNEIPSASPERLAWRLVRQLREPMALLLLAAACVSAFGLGERVEAAAIAVIVALNAVVAVVEEGKAARALDVLRSLETPTSRVRRDDGVREVPTREVVRGDVVLVAGGDRVPADGRLVRADTLELDESTLTGESLPVARQADEAAFAGTLVVRGSAEIVVESTGRATRLGGIALRLREPPPPTPLQRQLASLTSRLGAAAVIVAAGVFALTLLRSGATGESLQRWFLVAVALAVAAIPEGLAPVTTVTLALGARRMASRRAIVRRLPAVETLGAATVLLIDKTGTLTENRMRLESLAAAHSGREGLAEASGAVRDSALAVFALCSDATLVPPTGDPLEIALLEAVGAERVSALRAGHPRVGALPFDAARKRMTVLVDRDGGTLVATKGAPEAVLPLCERAMRPDGGAGSFDDQERARVLSVAETMAATGVRVVAVALRDVDTRPADPADAERSMTLVALAGLRDPVRAEAAASVREAGSAGIVIVMVTGDHPGTASEVARRVGLGSGRVLTGAHVRDGGLPDDPLEVSVYARMDPEQKLDLAQRLQARGHVVAMTGDGVNDAPALRHADIGVALGRGGSDVAREAADLVVTDDNLATIVGAVSEGRGIYANLRKVVDYLVTCNLSEILVVVGALTAFPGLGAPLLPLQLLWMNLITDGLPALALGIDPVDPSVMRRPPRGRGERLLGVRRLALLSARSVVLAAASIGSLAIARFAWDEPWPDARALMFSVLVASQLFYAFVVRRWDALSPPPNLRLLGAVAVSVSLQVAIVAWPPARAVFGTVALDPREWILVAVAGGLPATALAGWRWLVLR